MKLTQVKLQLIDSVHDTYLTTWLPADEYKLKIGLVLELKKVEGLWRIKEVYSTVEGTEIKRGWNNNI